ncbi:terpenoid synthase [Rhizodiscina lignyota]|uniref:Bifunctional lycopene cyclase/phytoene synthase n=1 Tax=Rhizodiscina lignyota TaxID=1504668 RepID=A0A9P4ILY3_9PEZI|nr:terpenoid synthase [Rhizodiscina lignyota]
MGSDYALVHLKYTIPPAIILSTLYRPLCTKLDVYKIVFLITIAVASTIPWDSYLIRNRIWTYPPNVIIGPTLFDIPLEELFFFIIQTYNTSLLYLILNKPTLHPIFLRGDQKWKAYQWLGQVVLGAAIALATYAIQRRGEGMYMGLILIWAGPFLLLLWSLAYQFILGLPCINAVCPIALSTLYLWIVDTLALRRGTWVIESSTKLGFQLWNGLEIEEAVFFLATNMLIVFGLVAFDNALAVLHMSPKLFPVIPAWPSPILLVKALLTPVPSYDEERLQGLRDAVARLSKKSRSFYLASGTFEGRTRIDLILLYSFCRVADDLVDEAGSVDAVAEWVAKLRKFLDISYGSEAKATLHDYIESGFPASARRALRLLPTAYLSKEPLYELLNGFEMDLRFYSHSGKTRFPIQDDKDLLTYGLRVAGTVAHLCLDIVFHHNGSGPDRTKIIEAGNSMGIALQFVNIARDISVDAKMGRVYLPLTWLDDEELSPDSVLKNPKGTRIDKLRQQLLDRAFELYEGARGAIEELPTEVRGSMRVAVESYMEIGRVLRQAGYLVKADRATVPKYRRIWVAWRALSR